MAKQIVARQRGDEYQQLVFWKYALNMLYQNDIKEICYEDDEVKSFDDIVVRYIEPQTWKDSNYSTEYLQVKFHMRNDDLFTIDNLLDPSFINAKKNSLLDNIVSAYRQLGEEFENCIFTVYSVWEIDQQDPLYKLISNIDGSFLLDSLFDGTKTSKSKMGSIRNMMCDKLSVEESELKVILGRVCIKSGKECIADLKNSLNERLEANGLRPISNSKNTNPYCDLIQTLFKKGHTTFSKSFLEEQLRNEGLYHEKKEEALVVIKNFQKHTESISKQASVVVDLVDCFDGRFLKEDHDWNDDIYPLLQERIMPIFMENKKYSLLLDTTQTIAFAIGRILDIKAGKKIIPLQRMSDGVVKWDKLGSANDYPRLIKKEIEVDTNNGDVALVLTTSRTIIGDVMEYIQEEDISIGRVIELELENKGSDAVVDGAHAWFLCNEIKDIIDSRTFKEKKNVLHLFVSCPNAMLFILGRYSLSFGKVQLYEYDLNKARNCTYYPTIKFPVKEEL